MNINLKNTIPRILVLLIAIAVAFPTISVPTTAYGATFSDIRGHWAESYINKAVSQGFVNGYPDGTFRPDGDVTRAEFTSLVNKALGTTGATSVSFTDVPYNEWYYNDVAKGISAAFVGGYDDNTFRPNNAVKREEAAVMISRFVPTYDSTKSTTAFKDRASISTWASDAVAKIYGKGYMGAYDDGKYHPQDNLTRAQAAKILCDILDKENIVTSSTTVKSKGTTLSGRIYSNNVTMHSDLGTGEAGLSNCVVLGTLYVYGGGDNTISVKNSRVANAYVEKSSSSVRLLATGQTVINKATTGNTAILETSGLSGGLYGTGFNEVGIKSSANTTLKGSFITVNINGSSADVEVESGSITNLNVTSSGRNSEINVNSKASIGTATVNSAAAFKGSGTINTMNVNSSGVTYATKPKNVKLGSGISSPDYDDDDDGEDSDITVSPKHKATKVDVDTEITITFDTAMTKYSSGNTIKSSDIEDAISIRRNSSSGTKVSYSASISSNKRVMTLTPDDDLDEDTKYYVVIPKNKFMDKNDDGNSAQTTYFTTGDESSDEVKFSPKSGATGISRSVDPTITFDEAIETYSGSSVSSSYLESNIIFREGSSSGTKVPFDAKISSSKKITISPDSSLKEGQKYYLGFATKKFRTKDDKTNIAAHSVTWTTTSGSSPTVSFTPANGATGVALNSNITVKFSTSVYNTSGGSPTTSYIHDNITLKNATSGASVPFTVTSFSNSTGGASATLDPTSDFTAGNKYTVTVSGSRFRNSSSVYVGSASSTFTAAGNIDVSTIDAAISAANTAKSGVKISANGSDVYTDVYWVTQAQWDALNSAITTATNAKSTVTTTAQAQTAANNLNNAIATFNAAKQAGSRVRIDTSSISTAITKAEKELNNTTVSSDGFDVAKSSYWVTQDVMNTFNAAISTAKSSIDTVRSENEAFSAAMTLNDATTAFRNAKELGKKADKSSLTSAVKAARSNIFTATVSSDGSDISSTEYWVTQQDFDSYEAAISHAGGIAEDSTSTQDVVDSELETLNAATDTFNEAKKNGTMS